MAETKKPDRSQLLQDLSKMGSYGRAEGEDPERFPRMFHPVIEHARAFDPNVILVIGPRGSGKSELFKAVIEFGLLPAIHRCFPEIKLPSTAPDKMKWIAGYPIEANFPDRLSLEEFLQKDISNPDVALEIWFAYLARVLWSDLAPEDQQALLSLSEPRGGEIGKIYNFFHSHINEVLLSLDRLDSRLQEEDRYIFVGYDELDTLGAKNWRVLSVAVRGLVSFWAAYTRRWKRIRAKIFLRTDLFQRYATEGGPDLAKIAANRVELVWNDKNLNAMLLKRIINSSNELYDYVKASRSKIEFKKDDDLGRIPDLARSDDIKPFIKRMAGEFMGANIRKGHTHRWLLNHIRDGRGQALPRPLVRLIEVAADLQLNSTRTVHSPRLVDHISIRRAVDKVSEEHVKHSLDEWPWLDGLKDRLRGHQVPLEHRELENLLERSWKDPWGQSSDISPPEDRPREFIDYLVEVGIFRARTGGRIDVPDLFLAGLGLKRKGGVKKK